MRKKLKIPYCAVQEYQKVLQMKKKKFNSIEYFGFLRQEGFSFEKAVEVVDYLSYKGVFG